MQVEHMAIAILLVCGLAALVFMTREVRLHARLRRHGVRALGTVTRYKRKFVSDDTGGSSVLVPIVRFADGDGTMHERQLFTSSGTRGRPIGMTVPVVYLPHSPSTTARIDLDSERRRILVVGGVVSTAFVVLPIVLIALGKT
jgi:hypothetical protein